MFTPPTCLSQKQKDRIAGLGPISNNGCPANAQLVHG